MFQITEKQIQFRFSLSSGPGGQNVQKRKTRVTAVWDFEHSKILSQEQKQLIRQKLKNRLDVKGRLQVVCEETRSQRQNREWAIKNLNRLVAEALIVPRKRIPTVKPRSANERRLREKQRRAEKKILRRTIQLSRIN